MAGATVAAVVGGAVTEVLGLDALTGGVVPTDGTAVVAGVVLDGEAPSDAGASVTAGGVGWPDACEVDAAAKPANTATPATPPAAIHRVAIVVRAIPRSRANSVCRGHEAECAFGSAVPGAGEASGSLRWRAPIGLPEQVREKPRLGKTFLRAC